MTTRLGTISSANQTVLDELSDAVKAKVPVDVHAQLTSEFVPAVREVARAGTELLKVYQALQKSSDQYVNALRLLIKSSKKAFPGAKAQGDGLNDLVTQYAGIVDQHKKCVTEFAALVSKTTLYGNEEKEKLREIFTKYQKEEKEIERQRKKGTKTASDMQLFVDESAKEFLRQQEMRYRFFYEKHRNWFATYSSLIPQKDNYSLGPKSQQGDESEHLSAILATSGSVVSGPVHMRNDSVALSNVVNLPSRKSTARQENFANVNVVEMARPQPTSISGAATEGKRTVEAAVAPIVVNDRAHATIEQSANRESPILIRNQEKYVPNEWNNNGVEFRDYAAANMENRRSYILAADPIDYSPDEPENKQEKAKRPPVGGRLVLPPIENTRPHYHVESEFNPQASPAHRPLTQTPPKPTPTVVPPLFNNSDYGRVLTVTQDFNATSGEQITVNKGNKVVLIKNGTRGWIFIKDAESQRTGWIPAPFVSY